MMTIQINTDDNIQGSAELIQQTEMVVKGALGHLGKHTTRVEVHLSDENGTKTGDHDKRCLIEARLEGRQPIAVSAEASSLERAIIGASAKLRSSLHHTLDRLAGH